MPSPHTALSFKNKLFCDENSRHKVYPLNKNANTQYQYFTITVGSKLYSPRNFVHLTEILGPLISSLPFTPKTWERPLSDFIHLDALRTR